jgi:hypothetical protein
MKSLSEDSNLGASAVAAIQKLDARIYNSGSI